MNYSQNEHQQTAEPPTKAAGGRPSDQYRQGITIRRSKLSPDRCGPRGTAYRVPIRTRTEINHQFDDSVMATLEPTLEPAATVCTEGHGGHDRL